MAKKGDLVTFMYAYHKMENVYEAMRRNPTAEICQVKIVRNVYARRVLAVTSDDCVQVHFKKRKLLLPKGHYHVV